MSERLPQYYTAAAKALATCVRKDEVKDIRNKASAMRIYAIQSKNPRLAADAAEIKFRATCRLGELMEEDRRTGNLAKGGKPYTGGKIPPVQPLKKQGVDKDLAKRARSAAKLGTTQREKHVVKIRKLAGAAADGDGAMIKAAKNERFEEKKKRRAEREAALTKKIVALPNKKYGVIYADPEWKFKTFSVEGTRGSNAEDYYPVSELDIIKARPVRDVAAKDCVLFLWATQPMLPQAIEVMAAWGFSYKSHCVWNKDKTGMGYWFVNKHEILLVGTCGNIPSPAAGTQWASVIDAPRTRHSEKPELFYELIEHYFPSLPKIELNQRKARKGWDGWGFEAPEQAAE